MSADDDDLALEACTSSAGFRWPYVQGAAAPSGLFRASCRCLQCGSMAMPPMRLHPLSRAGIIAHGIFREQTEPIGTMQLVFDYNGRERRPSSPGLALSCKSAMHPRHTSSGNHVIVACPSSFAVSALHVPLSYIVACSHSLWASCSRQEGLRCISLCSHASTSTRVEGRCNRMLP